MTLETGDAGLNSLGPLAGSVEIKTNSPAAALVTVPFSGIAVPSVSAWPPEIDLSGSGEQSTRTARIRLRSENGQRFKVTSAECRAAAELQIETPSELADEVLISVQGDQATCAKSHEQELHVSIEFEDSTTTELAVKIHCWN